MKREAFLRELSSEHHNALVLARRIAVACDSAKAPDPHFLADVRAVFDGDLEPHFREEERTLLPALEAVGEARLVQRTLEEHRQLRNLVARLEAPGALAEFGTLLKAHVRFEERTLFEVCQERLDPGELTPP